MATDLDLMTEIEHLNEAIQKMSANNLKYWFYRLRNNVRKNPSTDIDEKLGFVVATRGLAETLTNYFEHKATQEDLAEILKEFIKQSHTMTVTARARRIGLNLIGTLTAVVTAPIGSVIGLFIGAIAAGKYFLLGAPVGLLYGILIGGSIGYKLPKKIFGNLFKRERKTCVSQINHILHKFIIKEEETLITRDDIFAEYEKEFASKELFEAFLEENHKYELHCIRAEFGATRMKGYFGQHAYITFQLPCKSTQTKLELGHSEPNEYVYQTEYRTATGKKLLEMILIHRNMQKIYSIEPDNIQLSELLAFYKPGERDCHTYVDMLLLGTDQPAHRLKRFTHQDKLFGWAILGPTIEYISPIPDEHDSSVLRPRLDSTQKILLTLQKEEKYESNNMEILEEIFVDKSHYYADLSPELSAHQRKRCDEVFVDEQKDDKIPQSQLEEEYSLQGSPGFMA